MITDEQANRLQINIESILRNITDKEYSIQITAAAIIELLKDEGLIESLEKPIH